MRWQPVCCRHCSQVNLHHGHPTTRTLHQPVPPRWPAPPTTHSPTCPPTCPRSAMRRTSSTTASSSTSAGPRGRRPSTRASSSTRCAPSGSSSGCAAAGQLEQLAAGCTWGWGQLQCASVQRWAPPRAGATTPCWLAATASMRQLHQAGAAHPAPPAAPAGPHRDAARQRRRGGAAAQPSAQEAAEEAASGGRGSRRGSCSCRRCAAALAGVPAVLWCRKCGWSVIKQQIWQGGCRALLHSCTALSARGAGAAGTAAAAAAAGAAAGGEGAAAPKKRKPEGEGLPKKPKKVGPGVVGWPGQRGWECAPRSPPGLLQQG
jgi:hypothetical protein